jgi:phage-related tail fiber protein
MLRAEHAATRCATHAVYCFLPLRKYGNATPLTSCAAFPTAAMSGAGISHCAANSRRCTDQSSSLMWRTTSALNAWRDSTSASATCTLQLVVVLMRTKASTATYLHTSEKFHPDERSAHCIHNFCSNLQNACFESPTFPSLITSANHLCPADELEALG